MTHCNLALAVKMKLYIIINTLFVILTFCLYVIIYELVLSYFFNQTHKVSCGYHGIQFFSNY